MRVALVHDWLDTWGGGETVLVELLRMFPGADLFTLVDFLSDSDRARLPMTRITTSALQKMPSARRWFRHAIVAFPQIVESFDLARYDLVVSDSHAIAKGVRVPPGCMHVCYCHTPARFAWTMKDVYRERAAGGSRPRVAVAEALFQRFRRWDLARSPNVDLFVANSHHIAAVIGRCYAAPAHVVYPPVDIARFTGPRVATAGSPYVTLSRLVPYKRVDLIVEAFRRMPDRRLSVIGDGPDRARIEANLPPNVEMLGRVDDATVAQALAGARAFVFAALEDFGISPVEAQAAGVPVIAYGAGGALETIQGLDKDRPTGEFFDAQTPEAIVAAIERFEANAGRITPDACRDNAARFAPEHFRDGMMAAVESALRVRSPVGDVKRERNQ